MITDTIVIAISLLVATLAGWGEGDDSLLRDTSRLYLMGMVLIAWPAILWLRQTRSSSVLGSGAEEYRRVLAATGYMVLVVAALAYFTDNTRARGFVIGVSLFGVSALLVGRWVMRISLQRSLNSGHALHRVLIVASETQLPTVQAELGRSLNRFVEVGSITTFGADPDPDGVVRQAKECNADTILYMPSSDNSPAWTRRLGWAMEGTALSLMVSPSVVEIAGPRLRVAQIQGMAFIGVEQPKFSGPARVIKRMVDLVGAAFGLLVLALPMAAIALAIRLDSRGPVLFIQERMGRDGQTFRCLKFRTMAVGADEQLEALRTSTAQSGATFKLQRDPRVTRVGHLLRLTSIDELPQLWNVLKNEMSLVGPRPHQLADVERYDEYANRRLLAKPGMTGLWQVSGRSDTTWEDNVKLDLYYVENWTFTLDVVILLRTIKVVLTGAGAY